MKKLILLAAAVTFAFAANAKVWRINYDENANADFRTITAACNSAKVANTDTLYCEPGYHAGSADDNVISRKGMKVLGPGWGFEPNYGGTSTIAEAKFADRIRLQASNVLLSGLTCGDILFDNRVLKNIRIERCNISYVHSDNSSSPMDTLSDCTITKCKLKSIEIHGYYYEQVKNIYITNNLFVDCDSYNYAFAFTSASSFQSVITNVNFLRNTVVAAPYVTLINTRNTLIQDNIFINKKSEERVMEFSVDRGNIIRKNVFSMSDGVANTDIIANFPDNYYVSATEASTFTCTQSTYRTEQYFQLKDGSPAKNAAYDGGDCGAFGGSTPYIICGRPQGIPYITDVEVPAQPKDNKLTVTFKVANQNE